MATPARNLRVPDAEWRAWGELARARGISVTTLVRNTMRRAVVEHSDAVSAETLDAVLTGQRPTPTAPPRRDTDVEPRWKNR